MVTIQLVSFFRNTMVLHAKQHYAVPIPSYSLMLAYIFSLNVHRAEIDRCEISG